MHSLDTPDLQYQFYGAIIIHASIGPRQEILLEIELWPQQNGYLATSFQSGEGLLIDVRFGGIYNFEKVKSFWSRWIDAPHHTSLHYLQYCTDKNSRKDNLFIEIEFDNSGDYLLIHCRSININPR